MPVLSSPKKSCFGIDVYLDSDKELGSRFGKLSEAYKNLKGFGGGTEQQEGAGHSALNSRPASMDCNAIILRR